MEAWVSSGWQGLLDAAGSPAKTGGRRGGSPRCALSACDMSCVDLLRGLPLPVAPPLADLLWHGPLLGDDGLGLGGGDGDTVGVADDIGGAAVHDRPGPLAQMG